MAKLIPENPFHMVSPVTFTDDDALQIIAATKKVQRPPKGNPNPNELARDLTGVSVKYYFCRRAKISKEISDGKIIESIKGKCGKAEKHARILKNIMDNGRTGYAFTLFALLFYENGKINVDLGDNQAHPNLQGVEYLKNLTTRVSRDLEIIEKIAKEIRLKKGKLFSYSMPDDWEKATDHLNRAMLDDLARIYKEHFKHKFAITVKDSPGSGTLFTQAVFQKMGIQIKNNTLDSYWNRRKSNMS